MNKGYKASGKLEATQGKSWRGLRLEGLGHGVELRASGV